MRYIDLRCYRTTPIRLCSQQQYYSDDLADAIATYLQEGTFAETSDVGLFIATTRQAAFHSRRTFPPFLLLRELTNSTPNRRYPTITRHDGI
jgi:hypothetical protein